MHALDLKTLASESAVLHDPPEELLIKDLDIWLSDFAPYLPPFVVGERADWWFSLKFLSFSIQKFDGI